MSEENNIVKLNTTKFGEFEVNRKFIFDFVSPIIGFSEYKSFALIDFKPESPFKWLQSLEEKDLAFPVTLCSFFNIDYQFEIPDEEAEKLDIKDAQDVFVCNICNIPTSNPRNATVNMLAPIVINLANQKAMQLVLKNTSFEIKHKLFSGEE